MTINTSSSQPEQKTKDNNFWKIWLNLWQKIKGILSSNNKETTEESPTLKALKEFIWENPTWTLSKEIRGNYGKWDGVRTKSTNQNLFGFWKEVDYIAEKDALGSDVYKEIIDERTIEKKHQQFLEFMNARLGTDNRDERIKIDGTDKAIKEGNTITIPKEKVEELYSFLEKLWFPKGGTDQYGNMQSTDNFNIRIFRPNGSSLNMTVYKDEVKFNFYSDKYWYAAIWLPNSIKK